MQKWNRVVLTALVMALTLSATGCQNGKAKNKKDATARWNHARAGVMASLAKDQFRAGNFETCRKTVDDALKMDPTNAQLHIISAKLYLEQGQLEIAERELEQARKYAPNDAEPYYLSGVVYQRWQKPERAYEFYSAASDKAPAELNYILAQAEMLVDLNRSPEALSLLVGKVQYFENSGAIRDAAGQLLTQAGRHAEAVDMFRQATILNEEEPTYREHLALALYYNKQWPEAADALSKLLAKEHFAGRADLLAALGESQLQLNKPREARQTFEAATQADASNSKTWLGLGKAALECKDFKRAELALKKSQSLDPNSSETHLMLGYVRLRQNRMKDALAAFQKAAALDKKDSVSLCMVGYVYEKTGRKDLAMQYYGKALKLKPNDPLASRLMAGVDLND